MTRARSERLGRSTGPAALLLGAAWLAGAPAARGAPIQAPPDAPDRAPTAVPMLVDPAGERVEAGTSWQRRSATGLGTLRRLVRQFDFEDPEEFPTETPRDFYRVLTDAHGRPGFPPFGRAELTDGIAAGGRWSLVLELDGGSVGVAVPPGTISVFPNADYVVLAKVRTHGLEHAAARIAVHLLDGAGNIIPYSTRHSAPTRTGAAWTTVSVPVPGEFEDAADLVFELQLLQPRQFVATTEAQRDERREPLLEDISGRAWFDDVEVWRIPRVELSTNAPANVFERPDQPVLEVSLHDLASEPVVGDLVIRDVDGHVVQREAIRPGRGRAPVRVPLVTTDAGWYRASLTVRDSGRLIAERHLDLAVLAPVERRRLASPAHRFGADLRRAPSGRLETLVDLADAIGLASVTLDLWDHRSDALSRGDRWPRLRAAVHALLDRRIEPTLVLDHVPPALAGSMGVDPKDLLDLIHPSRRLAPSLQELLIDLGQHVERWQLGRDGRMPAQFQGDLVARLDGAERLLASLLPGPRLLVPWPAAHELPAGLDERRAVIQIPLEVRPESIVEFAALWAPGMPSAGAEGDPVEASFDVHLDLPPDELYERRALIEDLMLRTLHTWRAGARSISIDAPWRWMDRNGVAAAPTPALPVWQQLAARLGDRRFGGEVRLGDGFRCWIVEGDPQSALVAWNESAPEGAVARVALGADPVIVVDAFGNRSTVYPEDGLHPITVSRTPIFIEGVDMPLARFRAGFEVDPSFVPSLHREHHHEMVLRNPWNVTITGQVRVIGPASWEFNPRVVPFTLPADGETRLPLVFNFGRNELAGPKRVTVEASFTATREYTITLEAPIEVGFENVELGVSWRLARNVRTGETDLVISHVLTNRGEEYLNLEAFVIAPGFPQLRKAIPELGPGQTAQRIFQVPAGATELAGEAILVGVMQTDGPIRLTRELEIPALGDQLPPAMAEVDRDR